MMKRGILIGAVLFFMAGILACEKEGPAEKIGKKLDKTMEGLEETID